MAKMNSSINNQKICTALVIETTEKMFYQVFWWFLSIILETTTAIVILPITFLVGH